MSMHNCYFENKLFPQNRFMSTWRFDWRTLRLRGYAVKSKATFQSPLTWLTSKLLVGKQTYSLITEVMWRMTMSDENNSNLSRKEKQKMKNCDPKKLRPQKFQCDKLVRPGLRWNTHNMSGCFISESYWLILIRSLTSLFISCLLDYQNLRAYWRDLLWFFLLFS